MKNKERAKMSRGQRAKQFLPYDALEGWDEEIQGIEEELERQQEQKDSPKLPEPDLWPEA